MRAWILPLVLVVAGCRDGDLARPQLRRPIEALPAGAHSLVLASDLANTWQRLEAHQIAAVLRQISPAREMLESPELERLRQAIRELEAASGTSLQEDLVLNAIGGRAGVGIYAAASADPHPGLLLVAELRDAESFRAALASLGAAPGVQIEDADVGGRAGLRLRLETGREIVACQEGSFLVAATRAGLATEALGVHAGDGTRSALGHPAFKSGLEAVGLHNLVFLARGAAETDGVWAAQGFTWDRDGLHVEHAHAAPRPASEVEPPTRREAILASMPDGLTLAAYVHATDLGVRELLQDLDPSLLHQSSAGQEAEQARAAAGTLAALGGAPGLPSLPFSLADLVPWAGDEMGIALLGLEPTPLAPIPALALVVEVDDAAEAERGLELLESAATAVRFGAGPHGFTDASYGGKTYRTLVQPLYDRITPSYLLDGDVVVVSATRELMHRIIDTRRTGKHTLLQDASFRRFRDFVPGDASMVAYVDQRRLRRAVDQLGTATSLWGQEVARGVAALQRWTAVLEHFPAGAAYASRTPAGVRLRGWMLEAN